MPDVSVIVLNYNGRDLLNRCLETLREQDLSRPFEVVVVDNASTDGSVDMVRSRHPEVRVVEAGRNLGFAAGNNLGLRQTRARFAVLLNNDTRVRPGWLRALLDAAASGERVGAVTAKLVFADRPDTIQNAGLLLLSDGGGGDRGAGERDEGQYDRREPVFGFCGASVLLNRAALEDVGLFDETFVAYYEDADLSWRLRLRGWEVLYEPAAVVEHVHAATSGEWSEFFTFHADRNRLFYLLKNAPLPMLAGGYAAVLGRFRRRAAGGAPADRRPAGRSVHLRVLASFLLHLPEMLWKRFRIRTRRRVRDADVLRWVYPRERWDARFA